MTFRRGQVLAAVVTALLVPAGLAAQSKTFKPTVIFPSAWRNFVNPAYCYSIHLPVVAGVDSTDLAHVKVSLSRVGVDENGRDIVRSWTFEIIATPNPDGIKLSDWLEDGSHAPPSSAGLSTIIAIQRREDLWIANRPAIRKRVEGDNQRKDVELVPNGACMVALAYPAIDLENPKLLKEELPVFRWIISTLQFDDPKRCRPAGS